MGETDCGGNWILFRWVAKLSKSLIQFSVDGRGCVPSLLFGLRPNYQFSSGAQSCPTLCDPMNHSTSGLLVHHQLPEFTQTHVHWVGDAIQPSHPLSSPSPPAPNPSQHQGLFRCVRSSHQVAKVLEFQHQHQSFQWILKLISFRIDWFWSPCCLRDFQESSPAP